MVQWLSRPQKRRWYCQWPLCWPVSYHYLRFVLLPLQHHLCSIFLRIVHLEDWCYVALSAVLGPSQLPFAVGIIVYILQANSFHCGLGIHPQSGSRLSDFDYFLMVSTVKSSSASPTISSTGITWCSDRWDLEWPVCSMLRRTNGQFIHFSLEEVHKIVAGSVK